MRGATVEVKCKCCGKMFTARVADRARGWGKFCSKSCKATKQEARTGQYAKHLRHQQRDGGPIGDEDARPLSMEEMADHGQWSD